MAAADKREITEQIASSHSSFELVLSPVLFGLAGWWIDSKLGTGPIFAVGLAVFGLVAAVVTVYFGYRARMDAADAHARERSNQRERERTDRRKAEADHRDAVVAKLSAELAAAEGRSVLTPRERVS